jgi:decaprenyl-phosphate phosphoribosyltransferase
MKTAIETLAGVLRVKQWIKNLLLVIPFLASGQDPTWDNARLLMMGVIAFSCTSSFVYIVNDWQDRTADRLHPVKSKRPIAAGTVSSVYVSITLALLATIVISLLVFLNQSFLICLSTYLANSFLYTYYIKRIPVLEFVSVALGFILRGYAGAFLLDIKLSTWFVIVVWFSALYIIVGKRYAEYQNIVGGSETRMVLKKYSREFLSEIKMVSLSASLTAYCIWALYERPNDFYAVLSILPLTVFLLTYANEVEEHRLEAPETIILGNKLIMFCLFSMIILLFFSSSSL